MKRILIALLVLAGLWIAATYFRRFADPDPGIYGHPGGRA
jgi:hypothetical protein